MVLAAWVMDSEGVDPSVAYWLYWRTLMKEFAGKETSSMLLPYGGE